MARTLLQIVTTALGELGLPQPSTVIGNTDITTKQMLSFAQTEVEELNKRHNWTFLKKYYNISVDPPTVTTGDVTSGSSIITNIPSTAALTADQFTIVGAGIPLPGRIVSVDSATQITMNVKATASNTGTSLTFCKDTYPEPADFSRFENRTWWDITNRWELLGPDSSQLDALHRSGIIATGPRRHFLQFGYQSNNYRIWPPPQEITAPLQLTYIYLTNYNVFLTGSRATPSATWTNDTDTPILDDRAIIMGLKWRFWMQKGLNYKVMEKQYNDYVERLIARDGGAKTLSLVPKSEPTYISANNVQDAFFPGPIGPNVS